MTALEELQGIYAQYEQQLEKAIKKAGPFAGAFNMGDDPRKHACNDLFYEAVEEWTARFCSSNPGPGETSGVVHWILDYPCENKYQPTFWYTYAAQKHVEALIGLLPAADAAAMLAKFREDYPKRDWLPVQESVVKCLKARAGAGEETPGQSWLKIWGVRVILLLVGLTIAHLGVTLFLLADLGSDPFNVMIQGLHRMIGVASHGTVHMVICFVIILVLLIVDRSYVRVGTFLCMILGGPIIDVFTLLLQPVVNSGSAMWLRLIAVVLGCGILAFGMTIVIKSEAGTGPNDLVAVVISDKQKWKFGIVRIAVDVCFALIGFVLGGTVGVGTVICLAVVGPVAQIFMPYSEKLCSRFLK